MYSREMPGAGGNDAAAIGRLREQQEFLFSVAHGLTVAMAELPVGTPASWKGPASEAFAHAVEQARADAAAARAAVASAAAAAAIAADDLARRQAMSR